MEYERIGKVQSGMISPSKLRMKIIGPHHLRKKDGSNSNSTRTSTSRHEDAEFVKNSLLASECDNLGDEDITPTLEVLSLNSSSDVLVQKSDQISCEPEKALPMEKCNLALVKMQHSQKADSGNSSATHPVRATDDENQDCDSNNSSSSFEFHKGERPVSNPATRFLLRPIPSKWNDAEKWIMNRQNIQAGYQKKNALHSQVNLFPATNIMKFAQEKTGFCDHKLPKSKVTERVDFCQTTSSHGGFEKFSFIHAAPEPHSISGQPHGRIPVAESFLQTKYLKEVNELNSSSSTSVDDKTAIHGIRSVAMRDMGTEMTPVASQGPSRTSTPIGSVTPLRSPTPSMPSTPTRSAPATTPPLDNITVEDSQFPVENTRKKLSEEELKLKTRKEIQALGMKLGKMNIAAWAIKDEKDKKKASSMDLDTEDRERIEFEKRAASWEEAEKSGYTARYKREDIKIQAWESQQKAKLEAEMRRIEAKVEQMRAQAEAKAVKKIAMLRQRTEEKIAAAEARRNREAGRVAAKAEYIRQTGRMPSSNYICCHWL